MDHHLLFFYSFCFVLFVSFCILPFYLFSYFFLSSTLHVLLFNFPLLTIPEAGWGHSETSRGKWLRSKKVLPPHLWYVLTESLFWHSKSNPRSNVPRKETQQHCQPRGLALIPPHPLPSTLATKQPWWWRSQWRLAFAQCPGHAAQPDFLQRWGRPPTALAGPGAIIPKWLWSAWPVTGVTVEPYFLFNSLKFK